MIATILLFVSLLLHFAEPQLAYSECLVGRLTRGGTNTHTCGLNYPAEAGVYPSWVESQQIGADDETYNGFPFIEDAIYISQGGDGSFCGACIEMVSSAGIAATFMISDICDRGCGQCQYCNGSQGSDIAQLGTKADNDDIYELMTLGSGAGSNVMSYRFVSCGFTDYNMGLYFPEGNIDQFYLELSVYLHEVPLDQVEVRSTGGALGFVAMNRSYTNRWYYTTPENPALEFPLEFRLTSVFGEILTSPRLFSAADLASAYEMFDLQVQFDRTTGSVAEDCCTFPGPAREIYTGGAQRGELQLRFQIIESTNPSNLPNFAFTSAPCGAGLDACIAFGPQTAYYPLLVQYRTWFNASNFYDGIAFECAVSGVGSPHAMVVTYDNDNPSVDFMCSNTAFSDHTFTFEEMGVDGIMVREFKIGSGVQGPTGYYIRNLRFTGTVPPGREVQLPYTYPLPIPSPSPDACVPVYPDLDGNNNNNGGNGGSSSAASHLEAYCV